MMRTSRLRRWMLRGALFSAAAVTLVAATPAQADWRWEDVPPAATTPGSVSDPGAVVDQAHITEATDWKWE
jgi:hypothetical protein